MYRIRFNWTSKAEFDSKCPDKEKFIINFIMSKSRKYSKLAYGTAWRQAIRNRGHTFTDEAWQEVLHERTGNI